MSNDGIEFPAAASSIDHLKLGQGLVADQVLKNGNCELKFLRTGVLALTNANSIRYYYPDKNYANLKYLVYTKKGALDFKGDTGYAQYTYNANPRDAGTAGESKFFLNADGDVGIILLGAHVWSIDDLASERHQPPTALTTTVWWKVSDSIKVKSAYRATASTS